MTPLLLLFMPHFVQKGISKLAFGVRTRKCKKQQCCRTYCSKAYERVEQWLTAQIRLDISSYFLCKPLMPCMCGFFLFVSHFVEKRISILAFGAMPPSVLQTRGHCLYFTLTARRTLCSSCMSSGLLGLSSCYAFCQCSNIELRFASFCIRTANLTATIKVALAKFPLSLKWLHKDTLFASFLRL